MQKRIKRKIWTIYRKNKDDVKAIVQGTYPHFVYKKLESIPDGMIPIFVFHSVKPSYFENQMRYLANNDYHTIKGDELYDIITGKRKIKNRTVVLTFDDGDSSLWTTAFPILKKYGLYAICFILPFRVKEKTNPSPNIEDVWAGKSNYRAIEDREKKTPLCTWDEIQKMHESGVIDFQSHTSYHHSIYVNDKIVDFVNPKWKPSFLNSDLSPMTRMNGEDIVLDEFEYGQPIYKSAPSMLSTERYIEDENLNSGCINYVKKHGGQKFFNQSGWRKQLNAYVRHFEKETKSSGFYQSFRDRYNEVRQDLYRSKLAIEERLNKRVRHLCYPWYAGSEFAVKAAKEVGYMCNYWGIIGTRSTNKIGDNPYLLARISDDYLFSLPGKQRKPLFKLLADKFFRICKSKQKISR